MSGTGYVDPDFWQTSRCSKCESVKTWNTWYHSDPTLCDDCYFIGGKYYDVSKEDAIRMEREARDE